MTEVEWLASDAPGSSLECVWHDANPSVRRTSPRKLRLFACACCRLVWHLLTDERSRRAVEVAERYADGEVKEGRREQARLAASAARIRVTPPRGPAAAYAGAIAAHQALCDPSLLSDVARMFCDDLPSALGALRPAQAALLRDLCGNPWRLTRRTAVYDNPGCPNAAVRHPGVACTCPPWLTPTVLAMARAAYEERTQDGLLDPDRLAVLADALEDADCTEETLLGHLRGREPCSLCVFARGQGDVPVWCGQCLDCSGWIPLRGPHVRGCWALDLVLGKE